MDPSPRELPPPPGVTRSAPGRTSTPLPAAPFEWHAERMQNWLQAKAEEDRRVQEEERSLQETLKLERRKVEQAMLVESLRAGVPPQMIPFIFTSMSGGDNSQFSLEMTQQHLSQPPEQLQSLFQRSRSRFLVQDCPRRFHRQLRHSHV
ncbi:hypothetical protein NUU61_004683 [Penicillium alfredii]|uniref:Uncharacterized protein n=1 Tax=Penicillium alfredii TaxID=1506179 RepID=A0A9W9K7U3_9EURO|nr:uncharacterized protein NUU61_004683 [Penicillium alfredii]KAJ5095327.1 hypothetical protein NUU61_004683 [Penicillium alfredii]